MTKKEVVALTKRVAARIKRGEVSARPVSEKSRLRFAELIRRRGEEERREERRMRA